MKHLQDAPTSLPVPGLARCCFLLGTFPTTPDLVLVALPVLLCPGLLQSIDFLGTTANAFVLITFLADANA